MGFLDAIGSVLGGFRDVQMQDKYGPDWRAQKAASDFALQQKQAEEERNAREFERQQEEAQIGALSEAALAPGGGPESLGAMLPATLSAEQRKARIARALGRSAQSKSSLASQKAQTDWMLRQMAGEQRLGEIGARGDQAEELARLRAELEAGRKLSPRDQAMLDSLESRTATMAAARSAGVGGGGRPQLRQVDERGNTVWRWLSPGEEARAPATAVERQASGMAQTVKDNVAQMERLAGEVTAGPISGRISKASQSFFGPSGPEGVFDFLGNAVIDTVYVKSGKQINQTEMGILKSMIPNRARGNLPEQVRLFKDYANSLLQKYGAPEEGGGAVPGAGVGTKKKYRLKPGANPDLKSSYEEVP